ncbi:MAG: hypothetical protein COA78_24715, partial [Blastopirellula sp.]
MDKMGPTWCEANMETIVGWLQEEAKRRLLISPPQFAIRLLITKAIKRARLMDYRKFFERAYCVNLKRRPDRWEAFNAGLPQDWPFATIEQVAAVDGKKCKHPKWWRQGGGAWGCYRTHLRLIEQCLNDGVESVLLLEDDATFSDTFTADVKEYIAHVPSDWGMLYLGGQHLKAAKTKPKKINEWVYQPHNVNRTHAWALRGACLKRVYTFLSEMVEGNHHHIDHYLGRIHQQRKEKIYTPKRWLVGQAEGQSNINGREFKERFWPAAERLNVNLEEQPLVVVLGLHSSGS